MKRIKLILTTIFISLLFVSSISASSNNEGIDPVVKQVKSKVQYPEFGYEMQFEAKVIVVFSLNAENQIIVENVITENPLLKDYIINSLEGEELKIDENEIKEKYALKIDFKYVD